MHKPKTFFAFIICLLTMLVSFIVICAIFQPQTISAPAIFSYVFGVIAFFAIYLSSGDGSDSHLYHSASLMTWAITMPLFVIIGMTLYSNWNTMKPEVKVTLALCTVGIAIYTQIKIRIEIWLYLKGTDFINGFLKKFTK